MVRHTPFLTLSLLAFSVLGENNSSSPVNITSEPTSKPTMKATTANPTLNPTAEPTNEPTTIAPTAFPTKQPTHSPTKFPSVPIGPKLLDREFMVKFHIEKVSNLLSNVSDEFQHKFIVVPQRTGSNVLVQIRIDGFERLVKPGFKRNDFKPTWHWTTNIVDDIYLGETIRMWFHHYQDTDQFRTSCWTTTLACSDFHSRELFCDAVFTSGAAPLCDPFSKDIRLCTATSPGVDATWGDCVRDESKCIQIQDSSDVSMLCGETARLPLGYSSIRLPGDASGWSVDMYGSKVKWSSSQSLPVLNGGSVTFKMSFWALKCAEGEFVEENGFCASCLPGQNATVSVPLLVSLERTLKRGNRLHSMRIVR